MATVAEMFAWAWQQYQSGNLSAAEQYCRQVIQHNPSHADAHHMLGVLAYQVSRYDLAVESFRQALTLNPSAAGYYSNLGLAYDALGQPEQAVTCYEQALRLQPDLAIAHGNLGNALRRLGKSDQAAAHYRKALQLQPNYAEAHCNLAVVLADEGKLEEAFGHFRQAVAANPNYAEAHYNLGSALLKRGKADEAALHYQHALRVRPDFAEAHNNLGTARLCQGKLEEAAGHYQQALRLRPGFAEAHYNLGNALHTQGRTDEALLHWRQALQLRPAYPEAHYNLGNALLVRGQEEEALKHYHEALRQRPDYAEVHCNLGNALESRGQLSEALPHWQHALSFQPDLPEAHNNLGSALLRLGQRQEALSHCHEAIRLNAEFPEAWTTMGNIRQHLCQFDEALACYDRALALDARHGETHLNRALLWLLQGKWVLGWPEFEWRWQTKGFKQYEFSQPRWDGSPLAGRTMFVPAEQGLGDTLQFIRYVPVLRRQGGRVIAACQGALLPLLAESLGCEQLVPAGSPWPAFDVYAPLMSLPGVLRTTVKEVPAETPYLHASPKMVERWRAELKKSGVRCGSSAMAPRTPGSATAFRIGIAWQGKETYGYDRQRSIPLAHFAQIANLPGVQIVSLQKGPGVDQLQNLRANNPVLDWGHMLDDACGAFMDTAAIIKNLDLVICSDTSIPHLAGALGVPVWVALALVPDWRWLLHREDSPWYPTMRLFRQTRYGCWDDVFDRIKAELRVLATDETQMKHGYEPGKAIR